MNIYYSVVSYIYTTKRKKDKRGVYMTYVQLLLVNAVT